MSGEILAIIILASIGLVAGIGLTIANKIMAVKVNETAVEILEVLPGANCGACSFSGCAGYAEALTGKKIKTNLCVVGGTEVAQKIAEILGMESSSPEKKVSAVFCSGGNMYTGRKYEYQGIKSCKAASAFFGSVSDCPYGCIGLGDCEDACDYDAISIRNGIATVDAIKCKGCGKCVSVCPKRIIGMVVYKDTPLVLCSSPEKGAVTRKVCKAGCIGCKMCEKVCEQGAISFDGARAVINREKCVGCGKCVEVCKAPAMYFPEFIDIKE